VAAQRAAAVPVLPQRCWSFWAYNGWNEMTFVSGEVKKPSSQHSDCAHQRDDHLHGALCFVNATYFYVLTPTDVASVPATSSVAAVVGERFLGSIAVSLIAAAMLTSTFGALHISTMANSRVPFAMATDGLFPKILSSVSKRTHVPVRALLVQVYGPSARTVRSYDTLTDYVIFVNWIFFGLVCVDLLYSSSSATSRRGLPGVGLSCGPLTVSLMTSWLLISTLITSPTRSVIGLALVALGLPVYYLQSRAKSD